MIAYMSLTTMLLVKSKIHKHKKAVPDIRIAIKERE